MDWLEWDLVSNERKKVRREMKLPKFSYDWSGHFLHIYTVAKPYIYLHIYETRKTWTHFLYLKILKKKIINCQGKRGSREVGGASEGVVMRHRGICIPLYTIVHKNEWKSWPKSDCSFMITNCVLFLTGLYHKYVHWNWREGVRIQHGKEGGWWDK